MMKSCHQIMMLSPFFQFIDDLQQSIMRILDAWSMILTFEVTVPSYLTKSEDRTKRYKCLVYFYPALDGGGEGGGEGAGGGGGLFFPLPHCTLQNELLRSLPRFLSCFMHYLIFDIYLFSFLFSHLELRV